MKNTQKMRQEGLESEMALHEAAERNDIATMKRLIKNGASVNSRDEDQRTPLHEASKWGHVVAIDLLLSHGADPFASDACGQMATHFARWKAPFTLLMHVCGLCECRWQHAVDPLKINGADPWGRTPLELSESIGLFSKFYDFFAGEVAPCVNVIDSDGSSEIECAFGHQLYPVFQLRLDTAEFHMDQKRDKMSKIQTHGLRHLLSKELSSIPPIVGKWSDFVFGSVLQGDNCMACSWPCNIAHNSEEMRELLSMKGHPQVLYYHLMAASIGKCDMNSEGSLSVIGDVELFLNDFSAFCKQCCPLLQFHWKRVGSSVEGTKTGKPDEFDVLLEFTELSKYVMVQQGVYMNSIIQWTGMDADVEQQMTQWSPHKEFTLGVKLKIFQMITDFIAVRQSWGNLAFSCLRQFSCGFSAIFYTLNMDEAMDIKIDLVPVLSVEQKIYVFDDVLSSQNDVNESFTLQELEHMRSLPPNAQQGYVMAKSLRDIHFLSYMIRKPILSDLVDRVLPSHVLKHALFHAVEDEDGPKEVVEPHEWAQRIYAIILNQKSLRNFFSSSGRLLKGGDASYPRQDYLIRFIWKKRSSQPAFPLKMKEREYRELFICEIMKILN